MLQTWQNLSHGCESSHPPWHRSVWLHPHLGGGRGIGARRNRRRLESGSDWLFVIEWQMEQDHDSVIRRMRAYVSSGPFRSSSLFFSPCLSTFFQWSQPLLPGRHQQLFLPLQFLVFDFQIWWTGATMVAIQRTAGGSNISVLADSAWQWQK